MAPNHRTASDLGFPPDLDVGLDSDIGLQEHTGADPSRLWIHDPDPVAEVAHQDAVSHYPVGFRELQGIVDAEEVFATFPKKGLYALARFRQEGKDVGEIVFPLGVSVFQPVDDPGKGPGAEHIDAAVDLVHREFFGRGVLLFDDPAATVGPDDPAVPGRVFRPEGQQGRGIPAIGVFSQKSLDGFTGQQRGISRQDDQSFKGLPPFSGRLDRVSRAFLFRLQNRDGLGPLRLQVTRHLVRSVSNDDRTFGDSRFGQSRQRVTEKGFLEDLVKHFGNLAFHSRAFSGRKDKCAGSVRMGHGALSSFGSGRSKSSGMTTRNSSGKIKKEEGSLPPRNAMAGVAGFEPAMADPKSAALPLGYTPVRA